MKITAVPAPPEYFDIRASNRELKLLEKALSDYMYGQAASHGFRRDEVDELHTTLACYARPL